MRCAGNLALGFGVLGLELGENAGKKYECVIHKGRGSVRLKPVSMIYAPNRFDAKPVSTKTGLDPNRFRIIRHYSKTGLKSIF